MVQQATGTGTTKTGGTTATATGTGTGTTKTGGTTGTTKTGGTTGTTKTGGTTGTGAGKLPVSSQPNSCNPASATLAIKAKGPQVTNLQNILIKSGYSVGSTGADGDFGPNTQAAVKKFQQDKRLSPTGAVDSSTWKALCSSPISLSSNPVTNPAPGSSVQTSNAGYTFCTRPKNDHESLMAFINNPDASTLDFLPKV